MMVLVFVVNIHYYLTQKNLSISVIEKHMI